MLKNVKIEDIEQIEEEQKKLNKQFHLKLNLHQTIYGKYIIRKIQISILC